QGRPDAHDATPAGQYPDQPGGDDEGEQRQLAAGHGAEPQRVQPGHLGQGEDGGAQGAEGHGRGGGQQGQPGGVQRAEASAEQQGGGDGDRGAEAGGPLDEGAEAEGDEQGLEAAVVRQGRHRPFDHLEAAGLDGEAVQEEGGQDDPADGQQPEG